MSKEKETQTTASGSPVADNQNSLTAGPARSDTGTGLAIV